MAKTLKNSPPAKAGLRVGETSARLHGNPDNYVLCDERGTTISGPVSFVSTPNQVRYGGLFIGNNIIQQLIPSTIVTPSPNMTVDLPIKPITSLITQTSIMMALCGMLGAI